ncbi:MAG: hypothetical protein WAJ85_15170 [Candidatus Baltobacteraceae bacterium]|jgi:hypothetical protein
MRAQSVSNLLLSVALLLAAVSPARSATQSSVTFQAFDVSGGGRILTGVLGKQLSLQSATQAVLRRIETEFGGRPTVTQGAEDARDHSVALFFTDSRGGTSYTGMSFVSAAPGAQASAAVLYDTTERFGSTVGAMLRRLQTLTAPQPAGSGSAAVTYAPAEALVHHPFSDGTGSIDVPADWKISNASGGSASAVGPTGEIVSYDLAVSAMDPSNRMAANYLRGLPPQSRQFELSRTAMLGYDGDPVHAWTTVIAQLARQNGRNGPSFTVQKSQAMSFGSGIRESEISGTGTIPGIAGKADDEPGDYLALVQVTPPNTMGQWTMYATFVYVPERELGRELRTAAAVLESVRINFGAVAAQAAAIRSAFKQRFDAMIASAQAADAARQAQTDQALATDREAQEGMHRQAVAVENFTLGRTTVANTTTGQHSTVGSGLADALVQSDSEYQKVPASELLRGVDY